MVWPKRVYLIGAGGIGVSAVGKLFIHHGAVVSGSDLFPSEQTEALRKMGAKINLGHRIEEITPEVELVVYSSAVPNDDPERQRTKELGIKEMSYPGFLGQLSGEMTTVAVSGTHGKSTTTAMLGLILEAAGLDPLVIVGSKVSSWPYGNIRFGASSLFVVEACEHLGNFLSLKSKIAVITNIEMDHPDYYRDLQSVIEAFRLFTQNAQTVIVNGEDENCRQLSHQIEFGMEKPLLDGLILRVPGRFNIMNAQAAAAAASHFGVPTQTVIRSLNAFSGLWRRFEHIVTWRGVEIISDYAHHPTAIRATLQAARQMYPDRRIILCFQPHQHARTKELFDDFVSVLQEADPLVLCEIYAVAGRLKEEGDISSRDLEIELSKKGKKIHYASDLDTAEAILRRIVNSGDVVLIMGAGDIDEVARRFIE